MAETIVALLFLAMGLFILCAVGHGVWVGCAAVLKAMFAKPLGAAGAGRPCPACGNPGSFQNGECKSCGAALRRVSFEEDRQAAKRQLRWMHSRKEISDEKFAELLALFDPVAGTLRVPSAGATTVPASEGIEFVAPSLEPIMATPVVASPAEASPFATPALAQPSLTPRASIPAPEPAAPRASLADVLGAFMERRNIRWVELISGMLIVGSFIGLVISLRTTFSEVIPYFPALMFLLGAGFFHFVGLYTLHRWKLKSTSRAILIIATLLVPLSFMASIVLSRGQGPSAMQERWYWPAVALGLAGFGAMNFFAARALAGAGWWRLVAAVMGTSAGQLIVSRAAPDPAAWPAVNLVFALPLAAFLAAIGGQIGAALSVRQLSRRRVEQMFLVLGVALFGLLVALGLLVSRTHPAEMTKVAAVRMLIAQLSPSLCLGAALVLGAGLVVHQRAQAKTLVGQRMAGTAIAIFAGVLMACCVVLAWPAPVLLVGVGLAGFIALTILGGLARLPILQGSALACGALAWLVGFHLLLGNISAWASATSAEASKELALLSMTGESSAALLALAALASVGALAWKLLGRQGETTAYLLGSASLGATSGAISLWVALASSLQLAAFPRDSLGASLSTLVLAILAVGALAVSWRRPSIYSSIAGAALLWVSLAHGLAVNVEVQRTLVSASVILSRPVLVAALIHAGLLIVAAAVRGWRVRRAENRETMPVWNEFVAPLAFASLASAMAALPFILLIDRDPYDLAALRLASAAAAWLLAAALFRSRLVFAGFQVAATIAACYGLLAIGAATEIWNGRFFDPAFAPWQVAALGLWCAMFSALRLTLARGDRFQWMLPAQRTEPGQGGAATPFVEPTIDRLLLAALTIALAGLACYAALPGIETELRLVKTGAATWNSSRYTELLGPRGLLALGGIAIGLVAALRERRSAFAISALVVVAACAATLAGARFTQTATALCWAMPTYGLAMAAIFAARRPIDGWLAKFGFPSGNDSAATDIARALALALGALPTPLLLIALAARTSVATPASFAEALRLVIAFAGPVLLIAATWLAHAARERRAAFAALGATTTMLTGLAAFWLISLRIGRDDAPEILAGVLQWSAIGLSLYGLAWASLARRIESDARESELAATRAAKTALQAIAVVAVAGLALIATWRVGFGDLVSGDPWTAVGDWPSYAALSLLVIATFAHAKRTRWTSKLIFSIAAAAAVALVALGAATALRWDSPATCYADRLLTGGWLAMVAALTALANLPSQAENRRRFGIGATALGAVVVVLALGNLGDPFRGWTGSIFAGLALVAGAATIAGGQRRWAFISTALFLMAGGFFWSRFWPRNDFQSVLELCQLWLLEVTVLSSVWLAAAMVRERRTGLTVLSWSSHGFLTAAAVACTLALNLSGLLLGTLQRAYDGAARNDSIDASNLLGVALVAGLAVLCAASLWDRRRKLAIAELYAVGIAAIALLLDEIAFPARQMLFAAGFAAAGYVALTGYLWLNGGRLASLAARLGIPEPIELLKVTSRWLPPVSLLLAIAVVAVEFVVVLTFDERPMRYCAALAPLLLAGGVACQAQDWRRASFQWSSLVLLSLAAVFTAWADVSPGWSGAQTLDRLARLVTALSVAALGFLWLARWRVWASDWRAASGRAALTAGAAALVALLFSLSAEAALFNPSSGAPVNAAQSFITGGALAGLIVALLWLALNRGVDPLGLSSRAKQGYVYAAQVIGVLLWAHIYLVYPEFFHGRIRPYWPYIAMAIAFAGTGLAELFRKRAIDVLAEPFERTSLFLPLVPMLGFWAIAATKTEYWAVLFMAGLLYSLSAVFRRSFASAVAAAVTGNAGLLWLLYEKGVHFLEHPHFWMIPPALSVLGAAEANRKRLNESQLASVRYGSLLAIYISSTCEIFLVSAGTSLWSPMILATLAVAGVIVGICFRVRAFLYLGAGFVMVAVVSMVWHAQRTLEQSWPWWAFGMGLGAAIMAVFVMFERKRGEILAVIDRMRQWEK